MVLLFNDGEESLQDASHLYITQHNQTNAGVKAVVNLEACGTSGPELLFQATSQEMIEAYSHVPHPFGTVLANDVFSTGLILSDTDFRQFVEYGDKLTGLDMALVGNSYFYHTRKDIPKYLEPGATQHFGENTLAIIEHLCLKNGSVELLRNIEPHQSRHTLPIYFSIAGRYFVMLQNKAFKSIVMGLSAFINFQLSSTVRTEANIGALNLTILSAVAAIVSMIGAALGANLVAVIMTRVLGKGMSWYSHEFFPMLLYGPPAIAGVLVVQLLTAKLIKPHKRPYLERASLSGLGIFFNLGLLGLNAFGIGSAYLMMLASITFTVVVTINDFVLIGVGQIEEKLVAPDNRVSAYVYPIMALIPGIVGVEGMASFLDLFVPLTGRMGEISPRTTSCLDRRWALVPQLPLCHPARAPIHGREPQKDHRGAARAHGGGDGRVCQPGLEAVRLGAPQAAVCAPGREHHVGRVVHECGCCRPGAWIRQARQRAAVVPGRREREPRGAAGDERLQLGL